MDKKLRVLSIFGTRPEAVKMAPVVQALTQEPAIESRVCVTAQHREMLDQVLDLFSIKPDIDLNLMKPKQSLTRLTSQILDHLEPVLRKEKPDWVLVQGDTTTVMAATLASFYQGIHVGHVEAGLRTGDKHQPFPEEINRRMAGVMADLHFAPTDRARRNLLAEGVEEWRIKLTGNTVIDALNQISGMPAPEELTQAFKTWGLTSGGRRLVLVTAHRRENHGAPMEQICMALQELAEKYAGKISIVYPVHLNPQIQEPVHRLLDGVPGDHPASAARVSQPGAPGKAGFHRADRFRWHPGGSYGIWQTHPGAAGEDGASGRRGCRGSPPGRYRSEAHRG